MKSYIDEINAFNTWAELSPLPPSSELLWFKLMDICNRSGWPEWFTVSNARLNELIKSTEKTSIAARDKLISAKLIEYQRGKKHAPGKYKMLSACDLLEHKSWKNSSTTSSTTSSISSSIYSSTTSSHNKTKDIDKDIKEKDSKKKFTPPTVEEVREYCFERKNSVDAEKFVNYYSSNGWMVGRNKMKDWKASVRTWERNNFDKPAPDIKPSAPASYDLEGYQKAAMSKPLTYSSHTKRA